MLVVKVYLEPSGECIGMMEIRRENDLRDDDPDGFYHYSWRLNGRVGSPVVEGHRVRHLRKDEVWELVRRVLDDGAREGKVGRIGRVRRVPQ